MKTEKIKLIFACVLVIVLSSCVSTELPELPENDIPAEWQYSAENTENWPSLTWWLNFNSPELNEIMVRLDENNLDLDNNARNFEQAQIELRDAGFDLYLSLIHI